MFPANCNRCGLCCTLGVPVGEKEIKRIKKLGHAESFFLDKDGEGGTILKRVNGYCVFFSIKDGQPRCNIYEDRPKYCNDFPGTKRCTFGKHPIFRFSEKYKSLRKELEEKTGLKVPTR